MTENDFKVVCHRASIVLGFDEPDALGEFGRIEIDDMDIAVFFDEDIAAERIFCYFDLGPGADEEARRAETRENLLMLNFMIGTRTDGVMGIDPASGNLLMIVHVHVPAALTGDVFAETLRFHAAQAASVRDALVANTLPEFDLQQALETEFGRAPAMAASA